MTELITAAKVTLVLERAVCIRGGLLDTGVEEARDAKATVTGNCHALDVS